MLPYISVITGWHRKYQRENIPQFLMTWVQKVDKQGGEQVTFSLHVTPEKNQTYDQTYAKHKHKYVSTCKTLPWGIYSHWLFSTAVYKLISRHIIFKI